MDILGPVTKIRHYGFASFLNFPQECQSGTQRFSDLYMPLNNSSKKNFVRTKILGSPKKWHLAPGLL